ncbi:hypothetical protein [Amycolatopsis sp. NPDC054798]
MVFTQVPTVSAASGGVLPTVAARLAQSANALALSCSFRAAAYEL